MKRQRCGTGMSRQARAALAAGLLAIAMVLGACGNPMGSITNLDPTIYSTPTVAAAK